MPYGVVTSRAPGRRFGGYGKAAACSGEMFGSKVSRGEGMVRSTGCLARRKVRDNKVRATAASASQVDAFILARRLPISRYRQLHVSLLQLDTRSNVDVRSDDPDFVGDLKREDPINALLHHIKDMLTWSMSGHKIYDRKVSKRVLLPDLKPHSW